jgi:epoxyqueuosine reductase QueG
MVNLNANISDLLFQNGASKVGFADLSSVPSDMRSTYLKGISIAVALDPRIICGIKGGPTVEYFSEYEKVNHLLDKLAEMAVQKLEEYGYDAVYRKASAHYDAATLSTVLPHKTVATRAGLGWIGKCALLITPEFGSAVRLNSVLTNAPLETGNPINHSECGNCSRCVDCCPGKAPSGKKWDVLLKREDFFNAFNCSKTAKEQAAVIGIDRTICGRCIAACPWTVKYLESER